MPRSFIGVCFLCRCTAVEKPDEIAFVDQLLVNSSYDKRVRPGAKEGMIKDTVIFGISMVIGSLKCRR